MAAERMDSRRTWSFDSDMLQVKTLPVLLSEHKSPEEADLDGDGVMECIDLHQEHAAIYRAPCASSLTSSPLWESPPEWEVSQAMFSDLNRDGLKEATLLVWRPYQRWAIDSFLLYPGRLDNFQNAEGQSCHMILIGTSSNRPDLYRELWAGSAMAAPVHSFAVADIDNNGAQELIALESDYNNLPSEPGSALTLWEWNGFGFTLLARQTGFFRSLRLLDAPDGKTYIVTQ